MNSMSPNVPTDHWNALVRQADNLDGWNEIVSDAFLPMSCDSASSNFTGYVNMGRLDTIRLASVGSSALKVARTKQHIGKVSNNFYLVKFQLNGESKVEHRGNEAILTPGDFIICSSSDPYKLTFDHEYRQTVLCIQQAQLDELAPNTGDSLGITMHGKDPVNGMLSQFVYSLTERYNQLQPSALRRMEANVLDLLTTSLEALEAPKLTQSESAQSEHLAHIKQFIAMHLQDHRLTPDFIAESQGIGTRYLHKLFKVEGVSISRYIQLKRLELSARLLADPHQASLSTLDVAMNVGFNDASHFHRCFKAAYGVPPRQYRLKAFSNLR